LTATATKSPAHLGQRGGRLVAVAVAVNDQVNDHVNDHVNERG
jgi:hypothetical protein